ncbi:hypothetical protein F383_00695 [Gossypium arboreum]|uniref:Uncharacterized protein n=1 Tax=Gossypium arboreum TaxID=29729 RepID=A0A0B0PP96_GOSAR|nr:hypothetical protein F383_00695 [Gossypium arboreum]
MANGIEPSDDVNATPLLATLSLKLQIVEESVMGHDVCYTLARSRA